MPASVNVSASPDGPYVGLATRTIAFVLDAAVINLAALVVEIGVSQVLSLVHVSRTNPVVVSVGLTAYVLWTIAYFVGFWSTTGETPGDRVMRCRVVATDGGGLGLRRCVLRFVGLVLSAAPLFAGYLMILFDSRRRALHDRLARTVVVESPTIPLATRRRAQRQSGWAVRSSDSGDDRGGFAAQS